jgi:type II secretory pathway pseudopilin PulG
VIAHRSPSPLQRGHLSNVGGWTLVELMVGIVLSTVALTVMLQGFTLLQRTSTTLDEDSRAVSSLRTATDTMVRDLRAARRVYMDSTATRLHFWVDTNRDNQQDASERITYAVTSDTGATPNVAGVPGRLVRSTDATTTANRVVSDDAQLFASSGGVVVPVFTYGPALAVDPASPTGALSWSTVTLVTITLAADEAPGPYPAARTLQTGVRLRNATAS